MARSDGNQKPACVYCGQHHPSVQCAVVTNVQKPKEILKNSGRCFICIRKITSVEIAVHYPVAGIAMDDITPASVILLRHLQAQSVPKPKGVKVQLIRKSDIIYDYLCRHKEHCVRVDGKSNCIQSRK